MLPDLGSIKALFQTAVEMSDPAERRAYLDQVCAHDPALRERIDALLRYHGEVGNFLAGSVVDGATSAPDFALDSTQVIPAGLTIGISEQEFRQEKRDRTVEPDSLVGSIIADRYKIRQAIGEGGMGSVYLAEQFQPVKRMVALKLIKPGMDTRMVLARFESERQALAIMDHPHIARVLDAGTTEAGRPFFAMDLVRGIPLTDYCDQHCLGLHARLQLFRQICAAVQHAHHKGIIHRDLKPTNILVEDHDGEPVPKVIDFGLAKAITGLQMTEQSLFTAFGSLTGTPLYMAPEQASFSALDIDTRADIYVLGIILYELLTGSTPIRKESLQRSALDEILRVVREVEPSVPSQRIGTSAGLASLAASRLIEPARLGRFVRGDLDWIVMKALAKERVRRYDSAIGLANDIERFLNHEPVTAGPPTARYRTGKFIRRHRGQVIAASLLVLVLVGGIIGTTLGLVESRRQAVIAQRQERLAIAAAGKAERRLTQLGKINKVLGSIFRDINPFTIEKDHKPLAALLGERLGEAAVQIEGESIGDPVAVAQMQSILGQSLISLGYPERAIDLLGKCRATLEKELGPDHPDTLSCLHELAIAHRTAGQFDRAASLFEKALAGRTLRLGPDHPDTLTNMLDLAITYDQAGRLDRAVPFFEQALAGRKARLGPDHPDTLAIMGSLAVAYSNSNRQDRAVPLFEEALGRVRARLGPDHPDTLRSMGVLAVTYRAARRLDQAVALFEQALAGRKLNLGPDHPDTLQSLGMLAIIYRIAGQLDRAMVLFEETVKGKKAKLGADHPDTLASLNSMAVTYRLAGQIDRAIPLFEQALAGRRAKLGPDHYSTLASMYDLATAHMAAGHPERAVPLYEQVLAASQINPGPDHPRTMLGAINLLVAEQEAGRKDRAASVATDAFAIWDRKGRVGTFIDAPAMMTFAAALMKQANWIEAEAVLRQCLDAWEQTAIGDWKTSNLKSQLGATLLEQKRYDEARPLLMAGYEGMVQQAAQIPPADKLQPMAALDRLIRLAEATDQPGETKSWRDEKERINAASAPNGAPEPAAKMAKP